MRGCIGGCFDKYKNIYKTNVKMYKIPHGFV